jgi:translation initiation factor 1A
MPKNKGKGGKKHRRGANRPSRDRKLEYADDAEDYAKVIKPLGDRRFSVMCMNHPDKQDIIGHVRGKMKKREWVNAGDWVLISYRDAVEKCRIVDIKKKYQDYEVSQLKSDKLIKEFGKERKEDCGYDIAEDNISDDEETLLTNDPYGEPDRTGPRTDLAFSEESDEESQDKNSKKQTNMKPKSNGMGMLWDYGELGDVGDIDIDNI